MQQPETHKLYLADLKHGPTADTICVRVMRKWLYDGSQFGNDGRYIGLVLADEKGGCIYGQIAGRHIEAKEPLLQLDKTYLIKKFGVKHSKQTFVPFIKKFMIEITALTAIITVRDPPDGLPHYVYNIIPFAQINPIYPQSTVFVDMLGIITSVGDVVDQHIPTKGKVVAMREVMIKNLSDEELKVTLWADQAHSFSLPRTSSSNSIESIVILFVGCLPKRMNHKTQLNGGYGCRWFVNPNIREARPFYESLRIKPVPVYQAPPADPNSQQPVLPIIPKHKYLDELNAKDPYHFADKIWWYVGCAGYKTAVREDTSTFHCEPCNNSETRTFYKFSFYAEDDTAQGQFFAYDVAARNIIHRNVNAVIQQQMKEPGFPKYLTQVISKRYTLHIELTKDSFKKIDEKVYLVKAVSIDHELQPHRAIHGVQAQLAAHASVNLPAIEQVAPTAQQTGHTMPSSSTPHTMDTADSMQVTPPRDPDHDGTPKTSEPKSATSDAPGNGAKVRRQLFPEQSSLTVPSTDNLSQSTIGAHESGVHPAASQRTVPILHVLDDTDKDLHIGHKTTSKDVHKAAGIPVSQPSSEERSKKPTHSESTSHTKDKASESPQSKKQKIGSITYQA